MNNEEPYQYIIMDIDMPKINGLLALEKIEELF